MVFDKRIELSFSKARGEMVDLLESRGIRDSKVLKAMAKIPRHLFVPPHLLGEAYADYPLSIGEGQTISQPYIVALMTQALALDESSRALEIGTGSGYQTAILAEIAKEIYSVERIPALMRKARNILEKLGYRNIKMKVGDGTLGWPEDAPYDAVIVTAASPSIPAPLLDQLKIEGRMVIPMGGAYSQELLKVTKKDKRGGYISQSLGGCVFVKLYGKYGWQE